MTYRKGTLTIPANIDIARRPRFPHRSHGVGMYTPWLWGTLEQKSVEPASMYPVPPPSAPPTAKFAEASQSILYKDGSKLLTT